MFMYPAGTEGAPGTLPQAAAAADALEGGSPLRPRQEGKLPACQMNTPTLVLAARPGRGRLDVALVDLRLVARDDLAPLELAHLFAPPVPLGSPASVEARPLGGERSPP